MKIIKDAFVEGRETKTDWEKSKAKKNQVSLEVFSHNVDNLNGVNFKKKIPLERICPDTGAVLETYPTRYDAARWIVRNVLKIKTGDIEKKAQSITGNMSMCMACGFKSYGFFWKRITPESQLAKVKKAAAEVGARAVTVFRVAPRKHIHESVYATVSEAAEATGLSRRQVTRMMDLKTPKVSDGFVFRPFNSKKTTRTFDTVGDAAIATGLREQYIARAADTGTLVNNTKIVIKGAAQSDAYRLYNGRKCVGTFPSFRQIATATQGKVSAKVAKKMFDEGFSFNGLRVVGR